MVQSQGVLLLQRDTELGQLLRLGVSVSVPVSACGQLGRAGLLLTGCCTAGDWDLDASTGHHGLQLRTRLGVDTPVCHCIIDYLRLSPQLWTGLDSRGTVGQTAELAGDVTGVTALTPADAVSEHLSLVTVAHCPVARTAAAEAPEQRSIL